MFTKFATAIPTGAAITFALLFVMHALISMSPGAVIDPVPRFPIDWRYVAPPEETIVDEWQPSEIPDIEPVPTDPVPRETRGGTETIGIPRSAAPVPGPGGNRNTLFSNDGPLVLVMHVQPTYPVAAAERGLEGTVLVRFDVMSNGTVTNIAVVESSHSIFERAAVNAAKRFRFKARVVDGEPRTSSGVQYLFRFEMSK